MNQIIAFMLQFSGVKKLWDVLNGYKTKLGATGLMLAGGSVMLAGLSGILQSLSACNDLACGIGFARSLGSSEDAATFLKGLITFKAGLMGLGIGHKLEKAADAPKNT